MQLGTTGTPAKTPVSGRLRVLGLFSLPEAGNPLNLRRERHALVKLTRGSPPTAGPPTSGCCSTA
jgi:hypothetical protein